MNLNRSSSLSLKNISSPLPGRMLVDLSIMHYDAGPEIFDPKYYEGFASPILDGGRNLSSWFVETKYWKGVLRPYLRGGFLSKICYRNYIWLGSAYTRSFREFFLLRMLRKNGLRVPVPFGAIYWKDQLTYQASILMERIPKVTTLARSKNFMKLSQQVAKSIVRMHMIGIWHADLNACNILINEKNQVWLIDFDRSIHIYNLSKRRRFNNLSRLHRSLKKLKGLNGEIFFDKLYREYQRLWSMRAFLDI